MSFAENSLHNSSIRCRNGTLERGFVPFRDYPSNDTNIGRKRDAMMVRFRPKRFLRHVVKIETNIAPLILGLVLGRTITRRTLPGPGVRGAGCEGGIHP